MQTAIQFQVNKPPAEAGGLGLRLKSSEVSVRRS